MRKLAIIVILLSLGLLPKYADAATMVDYCIVPPYVIQDVPPNIMFLVDNSGSMYNFAYACPTTKTTAAGNNTKVIPVDNKGGTVSGIGFWTTRKIRVGNTITWIKSINNAANTITVSSDVNFSAGDIVQDYGCVDPTINYNSTTCSYTTVSSASAGNSLIAVASNADFDVGQIVIIVSGGTTYERVVTGKPEVGKFQLDNSVTVSANDKVYDRSCYYYQRPEPEQSFVSTKKYYGYFRDDSWYTYSSAGGKFVRSRAKSGAKAADEWDGNFLNWLTMRRTDVLRKVLTGGYAIGGEGGSNDKLRGIKADVDRRGIFKAIYGGEDYMGCASCTGRVNFTFSDGSSDPSTFTAYTGSGTTWTSRGTFSVDVVVPSPVEGVLQDVVGAKARVGLMFYRTNEGGFVQVSVTGSSLSATINQINLTKPSANTPLGEALWSATGYFAQKSSMEGGPGPRYASGDYQLNNTNDPFNYGTGGSPRWPNCSKSYVLLITDGEPCSDGNLPGAVEDYATGKSKFDCSGSDCPAVSNTTAPVVGGENFSFSASTFPTCSATGNVAGIEDVALYMHTKNLRPDISTTKNMNLTLYTIFAFGRNSSLLKYASINGGFEDTDGTGLPDKQSKWDSNMDGNPDTYYEADDGYQLEEAMRNALSTMLKRASSGTAASVLASGEGSGANLVQAVFYPRRKFGNDIIGWTGALQNLWYYVDPAFKSSSLREDTVQESPDRILHLINDYVAQLYFDPTLPGVKARRSQDTDGDGDPDVTKTALQFENMGNIWESARRLWSRDLATSPRSIFTSCAGLGGCIGSTNLMDFSVTNESLLETPFQLAGDAARTKDLIRYLHGYDLTDDNFSFDYNPTPPLTFVDRNVDNAPDYRFRHATLINSDTAQLETHIWKLGDILNSTPKIVSWLPLNEFKKVYNDTSYFNFTNTTSSTTPPLNYQNRGMVFTGGNDGMLHAFKLGKLVLSWSGQNKKLEKAKLVNGNPSVPLGEEMWAFIPKNALPYLKYFADPDYCHVFTVDLSPFIFDASIGTPGTGDISNNPKPLDGSTWRTIIIGGMRYGGACRDANGSCASTTNSVPDCVKAPVQGLGFSSYFALDITDFMAHQDDANAAVNHPPVLLWEFNHPQLGFTTTGPAVLKVFADSDTNKNGKWFAVFGSGPTGGINTANNQFMGNSDQDLRFFVLDLKSGNLLTTIETGIQNAFAGSMINATYDHKLKDYSDDAFYVGFVKKGATAWTNGGVGRVITRQDPDPATWSWGLLTAEDIGPVSSSITQLYNLKSKELWLYFGTGRYFYESGTSPDDPSTQRALYGVKDPCANKLTGDFDPASCKKQDKALDDRTSYPAACRTDPKLCKIADTSGGWKILLDAQANNVTYCDAYNANGTCAQSSTKNYWAERIITDPVASPGVGTIFFTTYKPYNDECGLGGKSFIWAIGGDTGVTAVSLLKGVALLQVSTGSIEQIDLKNAFPMTAAGSYGRKTSAMEGVPPTSQGLALISQPPPVKRVVHIKER